MNPGCSDLLGHALRSGPRSKYVAGFNMAQQDPSGKGRKGREEGERKLTQNPLGDSSMDTREMT